MRGYKLQERQIWNDLKKYRDMSECNNLKYDDIRFLETKLKNTAQKRRKYVLEHLKEVKSNIISDCLSYLIKKDKYSITNVRKEILLNRLSQIDAQQVETWKKQNVFI